MSEMLIIYVKRKYEKRETDKEKTMYGKEVFN